MIKAMERIAKSALDLATSNYSGLLIAKLTHKKYEVMSLTISQY